MLPLWEMPRVQALAPLHNSILLSLHNSLLTGYPAKAAIVTRVTQYKRNENNRMPGCSVNLDHRVLAPQ
jgi:hypothetical protein